jgi:single-strand DNA-binding protein
MSALNFNQAILAGRLTADPELKTTQSGISVTQFTVAVSRPKRKDDNTDTSDFISCVAWKERAELVTKYFRKGSAIMVIGQIQTRTWTDNNNQKRYATEILVDNIRFVDSKADAAQKSPTANENSGAPSYIPDAYKAPNFEEVTADDGDLPF